MFCQNCGTQIEGEAKFCNNCGKLATDTTKPNVDVEKFKKTIKNTGESCYAIGWVTIGLNVAIYLWSILDKNFSEFGLSAPNSVGLVLMVITASVFVILGHRIRGLIDKNIKLYLQILLGLSLFLLVWVIATGGRVGLIFFLVVGYLFFSLGAINKLLKIGEFTSTLTNPKYKLNKNGWIVFSIVALVVFFITLALNYSNIFNYTNDSKQNSSTSLEEDYIKQLVEDAKKQTILPKQLDNETTMVNIVAKPNAIQYQYVLHNLDVSTLSNESFKSSISSDLCKDKSAVAVMDRGIIIEYSYTVINSQETFFISFSKEDCLTSQLPATTAQDKQQATSKTLPVKTNDLSQDSYAPVKTAPVQVENPQLKIERCRALATSKVSEQNFLTIEQRVEALNKCNEPEWMFPDEKQPAYMTDVEWKDMLKRVCIQKLNTSLDELVEKDKTDAYNKYYSDCLNK